MFKKNDELIAELKRYALSIRAKFGNNLPQIAYDAISAHELASIRIEMEKQTELLKKLVNTLSQEKEQELDVEDSIEDNADENIDKYL